MPFDSYDARLRDELLNRSPAGMIVLIYEEAIRALTTAIRAVEANDIVARHTHVSRAMDVVAHLYGCLDMEHGGEIAANLGQLYRFVLSRLVTVEPTNDATGARDAARVLEQLLSSWRALDVEATEKSVMLDRRRTVAAAYAAI
jgi:flagellar protein FliS